MQVLSHELDTVWQDGGARASKVPCIFNLIVEGQRQGRRVTKVYLGYELTFLLLLRPREEPGLEEKKIPLRNSSPCSFHVNTCVSFPVVLSFSPCR